ncbi:uncharacterized protein LOC113203664 [Frankliniella occidentalis]|uniref:Uncharacterized protein LOC113203664 n=1 Tax=Frankliniella occidentalis TaxID=133901 RepID=A0A6J1RZ94_FRAOC|nr:uncharacterized protein LOC113203664 [Frankliniella occidentalis]
MYAKKFYSRIADDFRHKELLPLKMLFFVHASTVLVLYPYLTIHMRELGINVEETAIMSAVTPVVAIVMPPLAGIVADRIGNFKLMLAVFSSLGGLAALLLLAVPVGRYNVKYPDRVFLTVGCSGGSLQAAWADTHPCRAAPWSGDLLNVTLDNCGVSCRADLPDAGQLNRTLRGAPRFSLRIADQSHSDTFSYALPMSGGSKAADARLLARQNSGPWAYFPTPGLHTLTCSLAAPGTGNDTATADPPVGQGLGCRLGRDGPPGHGNPVDTPTTRTRLLTSLAPLSPPTPSNADQRWLVSGLRPAEAAGLAGAPVLREATCSDAFARPGRSAAAWVSTAEPHSPASSLSECVSSCLVSAPRASFCSNAQDTIEVDPSFTFWMYLTVRVFVGVISGTSFAMFEGAVIAILREHNGDYGLQRIYASIGGMISSPLSGIIIDYASSGKHYTDFRPAFYLYAALKLASALLMLRIDLKFKAPAKNVVGDVLNALKNVEMVCLFIVCFLLGTAWGYIENFLFWLLQDLGGSRSLMGVTVTVGGIAGIPLLVLSGPIIARVGHANVLFIGFVFYAIRLFGYSMIYNPWLCLVFEAMESFTSSLATTAAVTYGAALSTSSTDTSVQGLIGGLYYGVGKGAGSLIGGFLMKAVGTRNTYRLFAAGSLGAGLLYALFNRFYLRHRGKDRRAAEKEAKMHRKDHEACMMAEITKEKALAIEHPVIMNNKEASAGDAVQQKNNRNSAHLQQQPPPQPPQQQASPSAEKAPLARVAALRDYASSGDTSSARRSSAHSLEAPETGDVTVRRRKSSDCGPSAAPAAAALDEEEKKDKEEAAGQDRS